MQESNHPQPHPLTMSQREKEKYIESFNFPYCDESTKYEKVYKIGQGTFGYVIYKYSTIYVYEAYVDFNNI